MAIPPIDITDQKLARAYSHPLRTQILALLENRVASPKELAEELGAPLTNTSYHVRQLVSLGFLELVRRTPRRGAIEHYYTRTVSPEIPDEIWGQLPEAIKRASAAGWLDRTVTDIATAAQEGGFDRADIHMSRTIGPLDEEGWKTVSDELDLTLRRVEQAVAATRDRLAADPGAEAANSTVILIHFAGPQPRSLGDQPQRARAARGDADLAFDDSAR